MYKFAARLTLFVIAVFIGMVAVPAEAKADLPDPVPAECQHYVDQSEDYYLDVISNYQDALAFAENQRDVWQEAHDRVAENAVARNIEYAAEVAKNEKLRYKISWKNDKLAELRAELHELRNG